MCKHPTAACVAITRQEIGPRPLSHVIGPCRIQPVSTPLHLQIPAILPLGHQRLRVQVENGIHWRHTDRDSTSAVISNSIRLIDRNPSTSKKSLLIPVLRTFCARAGTMTPPQIANPTISQPQPDFPHQLLPNTSPPPTMPSPTRYKLSFTVPPSSLEAPLHRRRRHLPGRHIHTRQLRNHRRRTVQAVCGCGPDAGGGGHVGEGGGGEV